MPNITPPAWQRSRSALLKAIEQSFVGPLVTSPNDKNIDKMFGEGATDREILSKYSGIDPGNLSRQRSRYNAALKTATSRTR